MLLTLRFPMVDLRQFTRTDYDQVVRLPPTWSEEHDFVRYFGPVTRRQQGPVDQWPIERTYSRFDRVLRFPVGFPDTLTRTVNGAVDFYGINRRLFPATERDDLFHVDVQLAGTSAAVTPTEEEAPALRDGAGLDAADGDGRFDLLALVGAVLGASVVVRGPGGAAERTVVRRVGAAVARNFESGTMTRPGDGSVVAGKPAVVLEAVQHEDPGQEWSLRSRVGGKLTLSARPLGKPDVDAEVWMISRRERRNRSSRELRIHLLRLHSEREFLRQLCGLLHRAGFVETLDELRSDRLQAAIDDSLRLLTKRERYGFSTVDLLQAAFAADRVVSAQEHEVLARRMEGMRRNLVRRLAALRALEEEAAEKPRPGRFPVG